MSRRLILALVALSFPAAFSSLAAPADAQQRPTFEATRITDAVHQFRYESHNTMFVVGDDGVVVFDPISTDAAQRLAREVRRTAGDRPLRAVVYSHHHADHATGARALMDALDEHAPIVAHERTHEHLADAGDPDLPPPDVTFSDGMTLHLGDRTVELRYLGPSHADDMLVAYVPEDEVVFAVDFVANNSVGYRDLSSFHFPEQFTALERLQQLDYRTAVFGHGPPGDRAAVDRQIRYYTDLRDAVRQALDRGLSEDEAAASIDLPQYRDWRGYDEWFALNIRGIYRWLAEQHS